MVLTVIDSGDSVNNYHRHFHSAGSLSFDGKLFIGGLPASTTFPKQLSRIINVCRAHTNMIYQFDLVLHSDRFNKV